ncbi:MAG: acyl-CoA dehydrogenase family protein [Bdellovibrio sp.]|nr:acyl-CoA dehydrogenase family protein [Bdellovibrio sp.]
MMPFNEEHKMFKKSVSTFVEKELRPHVEEWEAQGFTPRSVWKRCGELGFLGVTYSSDYGGANADHSYSYLLNHELGKCGSPGVALGLSVQCDMATPALAKHGSDFLKKTYLAPAISGDMICSIAVTEPGHGSDVAAIDTKAVKDGNDYVINGRKMFITNGTQADFLTLLARTTPGPGYQGMSLIVVPTKTPGVSTGKRLKKTCFPSSDTAEIILDNVRVPKEHLIGQEGKGFIYQMEQFQFERLAAVALAIGGLKRCYDLTKKYIFERQAFGQPLYKHQVTRHKMAQMLSEITLLETMSFKCIQMANHGIDFTKDVSMLKLITAQTQQRVTEECVQIHGGYGLMTEYEVARYFRDGKLLGIGGGSNEIMKEIICKMEGME